MLNIYRSRSESGLSCSLRVFSEQHESLYINRATNLGLQMGVKQETMDNPSSQVNMYVTRIHTFHLEILRDLDCLKESILTHFCLPHFSGLLRIAC